MTKLGWAILALIVIALGIYVLRPEPPAKTAWVNVWKGAQPTAYRLRANGLDQRIAGKTVSLAGHVLPLAEEVANGLWNQLTVLSTTSDRIVAGVAQADIGAYGIAPDTRRIDGAGIDLGWALKDGEGYVYDWTLGTLHLVGAEAAKRLDQLAGRLDAPRLIPTAEADAAEVDTLRLLRRGSQWVASLDPMRPAFQTRMSELSERVAAVRLVDLAAILPDQARPVGRARLEYAAGAAASSGLPAAYDVALFADGDAGWVRINAWPPQRLPGAALDDWLRTLAAFREDRLFNITPDQLGLGVEEVAVQRAGKPWFRLTRRSAQEMDDITSTWDVVWEGGREYADPFSALRLVDALNQMAVDFTRIRLGVEPTWPNAVVVRLLGKGISRPLVLEISGRAVRSPTHVGWARTLPPPLDALTPDRFLDTLIAGRSPERVRKVQRRLLDREPVQEEVFSADERGVWSRTWPTPGPVDQVAVQRLARAIALGRAQRARFASPADRASAAQPACEIALRFAAKPAGKANDYNDLEETTTTDLGLSLWRQDGVWRAFVADSGVVYDLADDLVDLLRQPLDAALVLPLVPALVQGVTLTTGARTLGLRRRADEWRMRAADGEHPASAIEARRLLRDLAGLTAKRRVAGAALDPAEVAGSVSIEVPGMDREVPERFLVQIGRPGAAGVAADEVVLFVESTRSGALTAGRAVVPAASVAGLVSDAARFTLAGAQPARDAAP